MARFRLLEHTADIGIEAAGESLADLFQQTAFGLRQVITSSAISLQQERRVSITAEDREELLVNWLSELLYLFESELFLAAEIDIESIDERNLLARLRGEVVDPTKIDIEREVKAITYHQIKVEEHTDGWRAQVFVDL
ncbi:archease [Malonomonas rubra]|uniref:archease n=1 Tax=Malonomonas rubra TaxID=57040 RepID=UPI0026F180DF|nr:archease [Malonomonas rubra]